ncbi:MAG: RDD family protein [Terriglobales bacterium]
MTIGLTGPMTTASTNAAADGDSAVTGQLRISPGIESSLGDDPSFEPSLGPISAPSGDPHPVAHPDSWRVEVAARLQRYRTRRKPRTPRYPSLLLPFDAPEGWSRSASDSKTGAPRVATAQSPAELDVAFEFRQTSDQVPHRTSEHTADQTAEQSPEPIAKVIEFPRSAAIPVFHRSELADPVFDHDRPRIVEAPEILPPPPALGGILIESAPQESPDRRSDSPSAFPSASIARRALAALIDGTILATAVSAFGAVFFHFNSSLLYFDLNPSLRYFDPSFRANLSLNLLRLNNVRGPLLALAGALTVVAFLLWAAYEFLFVVYTGSTPGLRAASLRLTRFDGSSLNRRSRRLRVLASFLSAFSAGLGFFWCLLDQHGFCWHDRITRTHVRSA